MPLLDLAGAPGFYAPFLAIAAIVLYSRLRRAAWAREHCLERPAAILRTSLVASAIALQQLQVFYRPSTAYVLEVEQEDDAEDDDTGEPNDPASHLNRQLRRIRRGQSLETLVLRL